MIIDSELRFNWSAVTWKTPLGKAKQKGETSYISPRARARRTLELLGLGLESPDAVCQAKVDITEDLAEWDYGDYEGLKSAEIRELRRSRGLDKERGWDIWRDGCEGGESPKEVEERCDRIIEKIRREWHAPAMDSGKDSGDVLCVAHGHLLRAFAMRWVGKRLGEPLSLILEAGGVGTLRYDLLSYFYEGHRD